MSQSGSLEVKYFVFESSFQFNKTIGLAAGIAGGWLQQFFPKKKCNCHCPRGPRGRIPSCDGFISLSGDTCAGFQLKTELASSICALAISDFSGFCAPVRFPNIQTICVSIDAYLYILCMYILYVYIYIYLFF